MDPNYLKVRERQKTKRGLETLTLNNGLPEERVILHAYVQSFCSNKKVVPKGDILLPDSLSQHIIRLYKEGVLPIRLALF